jgi:ribonuclease VapC
VIVVDSSAVLAVLLKEPAESALIAKLEHGDPLVMSVAGVMECVLRLAHSQSADDTPLLDAFLQLYTVDVRPVDLAQLAFARAAFVQYGKGRHPARLNFGDCFAYALAKSLDAPLLFVGEDFSKTDLKAA